MTDDKTIAWAEAADFIRFTLRQAHVLAVSLSGSPGAGKTTLLEQTLWRLKGDCRTGVVIGDLAADREAKRLRRFARHIADVHVAELEAPHVRTAIDGMDLDNLDLLLIETGCGISGLGPPDLGEDLRVAVFSVSAGDDKVAEFPAQVERSNLVLLNKTDLLPHVAFDTTVFRADVRRFNAAVSILEVSAVDGTGLDQWHRWLCDSISHYQGENAGR